MGGIFIAFYGFFHANELLQTLSQILPYPQIQMSINLHQSKADPFQRGQTTRPLWFAKILTSFQQ